MSSFHPDQTTGPDDQFQIGSVGHPESGPDATRPQPDRVSPSGPDPVQARLDQKSGPIRSRKLVQLRSRSGPDARGGACFADFSLEVYPTKKSGPVFWTKSPVFRTRTAPKVVRFASGPVWSRLSGPGPVPVAGPIRSWTGWTRHASGVWTRRSKTRLDDDLCAPLTTTPRNSRTRTDTDERH